MVIVANVVPYIWHYIHAWMVVHILTCDHNLIRACYLWPTTWCACIKVWFQWIFINLCFLVFDPPLYTAEFKRSIWLWNPRAWGCSNLSSPRVLRALRISKQHISRWMKCLIYLEYSNNNHWQGHILRYLSWFIDDLLPIFVAGLLWIVNKVHVNNRLLSTAAHCCGTMRMRVWSSLRLMN